jgi:hypothetical protein
MNGSYRIKSGEKESFHPNLLTDNGRVVLGKSLASEVNFWAGEIAIGTSTTAASASDQALGFEYFRGAVSSVSATPNTPTAGDTRLIVKCVLPAETSGQVREIGVFSRQEGFDSLSGPISVLSGSENIVAKNTGGDWVFPAIATGGFAGESRVAFDGLDINGGARTLRIFRKLDLSSASPLDLVALAVVTSAGISPSFRVRFHSDEANYFSHTITSISSSAAYRILSVPLSSWTATGTPDWSAIEFIEFYSTEVVVKDIDGIRIIRSAPSTGSVLVSRAVLSSPVENTVGVPLEIEYYLDIPGS